MTGELVNLTNGLFWQGFIVFLRVGALMLLLPGFGEQSIPVRVRLALAFVFTLTIAPIVMPEAQTVPDLMPFAAIAMGETLVGIALGIGLRAFVFALQIAGSIAAQSTSLSQLVAGGAAEPAPAMGHVLVMAGLAFALLSGLHIHLIEYVVQSYTVLPAGALPSAADLTSWGVAELASAFGLGFRLATPFVAISLIYNLTLGIINRAMPQLMVAFVGAPAITLASLILLMLLAPTMLVVWFQAFEGFLAAPFSGSR